MKKANDRIAVLKTYKLYIGGQFPRTESGRYYAALDAKGNKIANLCLASRKDCREAIGAARAATIALVTVLTKVRRVSIVDFL